jgi:nicotinamide-nucleotide amidase
MYAEIITIGDELLIGQTIDTNSAWIAKELNLIGISLFQITSVADQKDRILKALEDASQRVSLVLITGGLGPTSDDITKPTLCEYFQTHLVMNNEVLEGIEAFFTSVGRPMLESNRQQAMLPAACTVLINNRGTASGMWFEKDKVVFVSMPGVPYEMKGIMEDHVIPKLQQLFDLPAIYHRTLLTQGIGESFLAEIIRDWELSLKKEDIKLAYLPSPGMVKLRLSAYGPHHEELKSKVDRKAEELKGIAGEFIFGENEESLESIVAELLKKTGRTLSIAESCTGGYLSHLITSIPGSSAYFQGSVVSYSNEIKQEVLGVAKSDLEKYGAVSSEVVEAMAKGVYIRFGSTYSLAISGIAGPDGGSDEKPVGLVWIALAGPDGISSHRFIFGKERSRNIRRAALMALDLLRKELIDTNFAD